MRAQRERMALKLLYCYIKFLDENGESISYHGMKHVELNMSTIETYKFDEKTKTLKQEKRKVPLPENFWANNAEPELNNIYNINVIAGENGSGKTTAIRCVINLLDYLFAITSHEVDYSKNREWRDISFTHAILIFEDNNTEYLLNYQPIGIKQNRSIKIQRISKQPPKRFVVYNWSGFAENNDNDVAILLRKTKLIHITNTLNQYDYERHITKQDERRRDFFVFDVSIGSSIGSDVGQYFLKEVYKQVKYVFDKEQMAKRNNLRELRMPHALRLRLRLNWFNEELTCSAFPIIGNQNVHNTDNNKINLSNLDIVTLLGMLCVVSHGENLKMHLEDGSWHIMKGVSEEPDNNSIKDELLTKIYKREKWFYSQWYSDYYGYTGQHNEISMTVLSDGRVISCSGDYVIRTWDSVMGQLLDVDNEHTSRISYVKALSNGNIVRGYFDGCIRLWNGKQNRELGNRTVRYGSITCATVHPDGFIICGFRDGTLVVWDYVNGRHLQTLKGHKSIVTNITIMPNGRMLSGSFDGSLFIWDIIHGECIHGLMGHTKGITCASYLENGNIVSGSSDKTIKIWNATTGKCLYTLSEHKREISCLAVLSNGQIVSGSYDSTLKVWDIVTGKCLHTMEGHTSSITCLEALSNGNVVSGSIDNDLRIWNMTTGSCLNVLKGHFGGVTNIGILPNGNIISSSRDTTLRVWDAITGERINTLVDNKTDSSKKNNRDRNVDKQIHELRFADMLTKCCLDYIKYVFSKRNTLFNLFERIDDNTFELSLDAINTPGDINENKETVYQDLTDFIRKYRYTCEPVYTIDFDWGLSSGEENMLRFFSNLYHLFDTDVLGEKCDNKVYNILPDTIDTIQKYECETILMFIDEADLTLHPDWQRRLISILTAQIPQIYPLTCVKDIQLILTTHSPLILGDIPGENITYLFSKEKELEKTKGKSMGDMKANNTRPIPEETFGQNIHSILKESFFLKDGTIGAFAAGKINMVAERLDEIIQWTMKKKKVNAPQAGEMKYIRQIIDLVAPGVLRNKLEILFQEANASLEEIKKGKETKRGKKAEAISKAQELVHDYWMLPQEEREYVMRAMRQEELSQ